MTTVSRSILIVKIGGGYLKAILPGGGSTVFGRDHAELVGRLKQIRVVEKPAHLEKRNPR